MKPSGSQRLAEVNNAHPYVHVVLVVLILRSPSEPPTALPSTMKREQEESMGASAVRITGLIGLNGTPLLAWPCSFEVDPPVSTTALNGLLFQHHHHFVPSFNKNESRETVPSRLVVRMWYEID